MPILSNPRDNPDQVSQRAAQADPWVMYLVVNQEVAASATQLLIAGAQATVRCAEAFREAPAWAESFRAWSERSFRKVSLRAKGSAWGKLGGYEAGEASVGGRALVRALPPRLRSECGPLLKSLQVFNPDPAQLAPEPEASEQAPGAPVMRFVLNPAASMSVGKQLAQVAHAVLMCAWSDWARDPRYQAAFAAWGAGGYPCEILPSSSWAARMASADGVVVRDAGLTEVDPGTETVLAMPPG